MITLLYLAVCVALAFNGVLQFGMGLCTLMSIPGQRMRSGLQPALTMVAVSFFTWIFFYYVLTPLALGLLEPLLLFPFTVFISLGVEYILPRIDHFDSEEDRVYGTYLYTGLALVSAIVTLQLASGLLEALIIACSMAIGYLGALYLLAEIQKRSYTELVPVFLRGIPLTLISAGLLSLISFTLASIIFSSLI